MCTAYQVLLRMETKHITGLERLINILTGLGYSVLNIPTFIAHKTLSYTMLSFLALSYKYDQMKDTPYSFFLTFRTKV